MGSVLLAVAMWAGTACGGGAAVDAAQEEVRLVVLVNAARAGRNLSPLIRSALLDEFARENSRRMARSGRVAHSASAAFRHLGMAAWAENVGSGPGIEGIHERMLASPRHRDNLLGPYGLVGVAVAVATDGRRYVTVVFGTARTQG